MSTVVELLSGILRFFPNTIIATLFFLGIALGKPAWILIAAGGVAVAILVLTLQYIGGKAFGFSGLPGSAVMETCSILPIATANVPYFATPSLWVSLTSFIASFIFMNAINIYTQTTAGTKQNAIPVVQRKGVGLISILAVTILFATIVIPRYWTNCETLAGLITGLIIGIGSGVTWWYILDACGADVYPDIHGIMIGLKPGGIRSNPLACSSVVP